MTALDRGSLQGPSVAAVLGSAAEMESDHYLSELLRSVAARYSLEPSLRETYLRAVDSIESDHYRSEVLGALRFAVRRLEGGDPPPLPERPPLPAPAASTGTGGGFGGSASLRQAGIRVA